MEGALEPRDISITLEPEGSAMELEGQCVATPYGDIKVTVQGNSSKPAILTYHDIGLNHYTNFARFLSDSEVAPLAEEFCWYHVDAPGQELDAGRLPADYLFPSVTQMAEQLEYIADHFDLSCFVGVGVGLGANILARYAVLSPERLRGLLLVNLRPDPPSWASLEGLWGKVLPRPLLPCCTAATHAAAAAAPLSNQPSLSTSCILLGVLVVQLPRPSPSSLTLSYPQTASWQNKGRQQGLSQLASTLLTRHTFGPSSPDVDADLVSLFLAQLSSHCPHNLSLLLHNYYARSSVAVEFATSVKCDCLFIVTSNFQHKDQVEKLCSLLGSNKGTLLEVGHSSGLLLDHHPAKVATALRLFVQGLGMVPSFSSLTTLPHPAGPPHPLQLHGHAISLLPMAC